MYEDRAGRAQRERDAELIKKGERHKLKTGYCNAGHCEGTKPRGRDGTPHKTCPQFQLCPCTCHTDLDEMFALAGKERTLVENPDYEPVKSAHFEAAVIEAPSVLDVDAKVPDDVLVSPAPGIVPGARMKVFNETPSGRAARGQLELYVKAVTDIWFIEQERTPCTVSYIAEQIAIMQGIPTPQLSGVDSVLKRWEEIGFATLDRKPTRFTGYTPESLEYGLDGMRERAKKAARRMAFQF